MGVIIKLNPFHRNSIQHPSLERAVSASKMPAEDLFADRQAAVSKLRKGILEPAVSAGKKVSAKAFEDRN
jgi:hypothetical protein